MKKILLTSFQTWLPHQKSNSSDDLIAIIENQSCDFASLFCLRQLPVNIEQASQEAIATLAQFQFDAIVCCGMAEKRKKLTLESNAVGCDRCLYTSINLLELVELLTDTTVSHDAGKFVCEGLYYQLLNHLELSEISIPCLFVHVPQLNTSNLQIIQQDFYAILRYISNFTTAQ
ncbi:MAG: peptidase C15 [Pleurocapsa sp.]